MAKRRAKHDTEPISASPPPLESAHSRPHATLRRPILLLACALVIAAALLLRLWSDRLPEPATGTMTLETAEQRARAAPNDVEAQLDWGVLLYKAGRFEAAEAALTQACQLAPKDARPFGWRAQTALALKRPDAARTDFQEALQRDPNDPDVWRGLARVYEQTHASADAVTAYRRLTQLRPREASAWRQLGIHYVRLGSWLPGRNALKRAVELDPSDVSALHHLGLVCIRQGRLTEAKDALDRVLARDPNHPASLTLQAELTLRLDSSPEGLTRAEQQINHALAQGATGPRHQMRGRIYLAQRRYAQAIEEGKTALRLDPNLVTAYVYLSQAYALNGQPEKAREASRDYMKNRRERPQDVAREGTQP